MNEWALFQSNIYSFKYNWRLDRLSYFFSLFIVFIMFVIMPGMIIDKFNIYSDDYIRLVGVIDYIVVILALAIVSLQRIMDIGRLWLYIVVWIGIILYFLYNPIDISENVITVTRNVDSIETILNINIDFIFGILSTLLFLSGTHTCNKYGEANGVIKTNWGYIHYPFLENWNKFKEEFSFYKVIPIIEESGSLQLFNISKRVSRGEILYYYIGYQLIVILFILLMIMISSIVPKNEFISILLEYVFDVAYIWVIIYIVRLGIMRLHDSGSSALWLLGLLLPYINMYVIYLLFGKGSWRFVKAF
ncbi:DUF805 domain-containing protein [uncultured Veillonella sp.]|uniref:DUF805 domain-containing protein n=1 Tax=uncultured Veillonella sp. TaxID=159268 RepID=UPI0026108013|nr:DUF805 domain-containing protein [uncultured Veillonella sp.]